MKIDSIVATTHGVITLTTIISEVCVQEALLAHESHAETISEVLVNHLPIFQGPIQANLIGERPVVFQQLDLRGIYRRLGKGSSIWVKTMDGLRQMCLNLGELRNWLPESNGVSIYLPLDDPATLLQIESTINTLIDAVPIRYAATDLFSNDDRSCGLEGQTPTRPLPSGALHLGLTDVFWYNYFGPEYVALIGSERFQDLPMASVAEVQAGYRIVLNELPVVPPTDTFRTAQAEIRRRLGNELFADERQDPTVEGPEILVPDFYAKQRVLDEEHRIQRRKHAESLTRTDLPRIPTSDILSQVRKKGKTT